MIKVKNGIEYMVDDNVQNQKLLNQSFQKKKNDVILNDLVLIHE